MYKEGTRLGLRFQTAKGNLSIEQLWTLGIDELDSLAVALEKEYADSGKKSFVVKKSVKDKMLKLRFDIVLDILNTKVEEQEAEKEQREIKAHNEHILEIIAEKQEESLKGKSIAELKRMLK